MNLDAIMWIALFVVAVAMAGYLLAVLLHPEKW